MSKRWNERRRVFEASLASLRESAPAAVNRMQILAAREARTFEYDDEPVARRIRRRL